MTDSEILIRTLFSGYNKLASNREKLNSLNVFPIADKDTGANMARTMKAGVEAVKGMKDSDALTVLERFSKAAIRGARGNSGVILSVLFKGFSDAAREKGGVFPNTLRYCLHCAFVTACASLSEPVVEGTMLYIAAAARNCPGDFETASLAVCLERITAECKKALDETENCFLQLKNGKTADSGAFGLFLIISAAGEILAGKNETFSSSPISARIKSAGERLAEEKYCTEFIVIKNSRIPARTLEKGFALSGQASPWSRTGR